MVQVPSSSWDLIVRRSSDCPVEFLKFSRGPAAEKDRVERTSLIPVPTRGSLVAVVDPLYDDGGLVLDENGVTIRRYYFPTAAAKRIPYTQIRHATVRPMGWLTGRGRGWGTAHPGYWFPLDLRRASKRILVVFDLGHRVKPCVSPGDPDRFIGLLHGRVSVR
jgi:hypothetical protein